MACQMRFLITRPRPDADELAAMLEARGHETLISPVMEVVFHKVAPPPPETVSGLVITSKNALRSLERNNALAPFSHLPLFAVGKSSAKIARQCGFSTVFEAAGHARTLPALIEKHLDAGKSAPLYHPGGKKLAFDIGPILQERGFARQRHIVYETRKIPLLSPAAIKGLEAGDIDGVLLLSPRSAQLFGQLVKTHRLQQKMNKTDCLCLSQKVANTINELNWREKRVASYPDTDHLIDLADQMG